VPSKRCDGDPIEIMTPSGFIHPGEEDDLSPGIACSSRDAVDEFLIKFAIVVTVVCGVLLGAIGQCCGKEAGENQESQKDGDSLSGHIMTSSGSGQKSTLNYSFV
jgi:hypothetical protein